MTENHDHLSSEVLEGLSVGQKDEAELARTMQRKSSSLYAVVFSGLALMSDGYQLGVISVANVCFTRLYGDTFTTEVAARVSNALLFGLVLGQVSFGVVCDRVGRKFGMMSTTFLVVLGAALCSGAYGAHGSVEGLFWALTISRGILGVGIGGEYPCSSASASESADDVMEGRRGTLVVLVTNVVIDIGIVFASLVPLLLGLAGCGYEAIWRASFAIGVLPPLTALYFRLRLVNSEHFQRNAIKRNVPYRLVLKRYWRHLLGTAGSWFIYDFIVYPFGIFTGVILDTAIGSNASIVQIASWSCLLSVFYLPGSIGGAFSSDYIGRKNTITLGFLVQGIVGIFLGIFYKNLLGVFPLFVVLYGIFSMLGEFPGDMVILVAAEAYPTAIRGTAYGWSAAIGKVGAICGTYAFKPAIESFGRGDMALGQGRVFILASAVAILGAIFSWFLVPDYTKQELGQEDEAFRQYLIENGYDVTQLGETATLNDEQEPIEAQKQATGTLEQKEAGF
ncbi:Plasma membrane permease, mediates uptake of glycerophosphoinositol and glycerophosphocholine [Lunasporangiospora selenospora]|uniref:Plasma membrane permease, mediates uptake of glycerophosphoinositol and glycerophosphocholine n=1 Tax=Lunasporangiospora selenospora TaxID=979761 RepID=A0A9P6G2V6_9FUNG|nr:Plasma membrane permease, mediates uptake of glycerophosphoinositol and glycerophosphocholine [Lunasporangiospora selenospora]